MEEVRLKSGLKDSRGLGSGSIRENGEERMNWREIAKGKNTASWDYRIGHTRVQVQTVTY